MAKTTKNNEMEVKKKAIIEAYAKTYGNVTETCKIVGINRSTYYDWLKDDLEFKMAIDNVEPEEQFVDFVENALHQKIKDGDTTAIIFALKTKGKKRGYVEKTEHEIDGKISAIKIIRETSTPLS
jgi:uncharacterized Zn ribbon protein